MGVNRGVGLLVYLLLAVSLSVAQSSNGTISGIVLDPSGGLIVGADVLIINNATGAQYPGKANSEGYYVVPNIPPGNYRIQVSNTGFKTIIKPDIVIHVEDALAINFTLPIGAASEIVTVEGGAPLINTESASVGTVIDRNFVGESAPQRAQFQHAFAVDARRCYRSKFARRTRTIQHRWAENRCEQFSVSTVFPRTSVLGKGGLWGSRDG